ncbi:hypothetical protein ABZ260_35955, partial [Streptosporangium sp. NPDC006013]|uniref:hypothetical protein n=1 Tax=Streptosporangium sp. NPDC006013 TaxID=3155596 RepID=UPI0033B3A87B
AGGEWTLHAQGVLAERAAEPGFDLVQWPPAGNMLDRAGKSQNAHPIKARRTQDAPHVTHAGPHELEGFMPLSSPETYPV